MHHNPAIRRILRLLAQDVIDNETAAKMIASAIQDDVCDIPCSELRKHVWAEILKICG